MRGLLSRRIPALDRVLVVESGPREVIEKFLRHLYQVQDSPHVDVVTCFGNSPEEFRPDRGTLYSIHDSNFSGRRRQLLDRFAANRYSIVALLCTGSSIMMRWKWAIAMRCSSRIVIVNESGDFFHLNLQQHRNVRLMVSQRAGVAGGLRLNVAAELLMFPFTVAFLLLYAGAIHGRRLIRTGGHRRIG